MATKRRTNSDQGTACGSLKTPQARANAGAQGAGIPPAKRLRLPLRKLDEVKAELARLYREGKAGQRDVSDVSKLAHVLNLLGRLIVDQELESRVQALEQKGGMR